MRGKTASDGRWPGQNAQTRADQVGAVTEGFESLPVREASLADVDATVVQEYLARRQALTQQDMPAEATALLASLRLLRKDGDLERLTVSGLLLFGAQPQRFLPQSGLVFVRFAGTGASGRDGLPGYVRREDVEGPLCRIVERAWQLVWEEMAKEAVITDLRREERPEYPPFAVREAIVNAIAHRDYSIAGARNEIRMYDDRLEVISPGGLAGHITLDNIVREHYSRNPRLVRELFQWGYIEELGLGIDKMIESMESAGHKSPTFSATPHSFTVTLTSNRRQSASSTLLRGLTPRQRAAAEYAIAHGRITNQEMRSLFPDVSGETVRTDLAELVAKGVLFRIGEKKGTFYVPR